MFRASELSLYLSFKLQIKKKISRITKEYLSTADQIVQTKQDVSFTSVKGIKIEKEGVFIRVRKGCLQARHDIGLLHITHASFFSVCPFVWVCEDTKF